VDCVSSVNAVKELAARKSYQTMKQVIRDSRSVFRETYWAYKSTYQRSSAMGAEKKGHLKDSPLCPKNMENEKQKSQKGREAFMNNTWCNEIEGSMYTMVRFEGDKITKYVLDMVVYATQGITLPDGLAISVQEAWQHLAEDKIRRVF
jgi:hypothetical protein